MDVIMSLEIEKTFLLCEDEITASVTAVAKTDNRWQSKPNHCQNQEVLSDY